MSLRKLIEGAGLTVNACADVVGVDRKLFGHWSDFQAEMPPAYASILAATLGVKVEALSMRRTLPDSAFTSAPAAIWFKFRGDTFTEADRESILLIRRLGHNANQLEQATSGQVNRTWSIQFEQVRLAVDLQSSPEEQGKTAARVFCELNQLDHGAKSSAEIIRSRLRSQGIVLIESPIPDSQMEGCSFYVGDSAFQRPCLFANNYKTSWFRRNAIIMHELCHAIFDRASGGEVDLREELDSRLLDDASLEEVRAKVFAQEVLLPRKVILGICNRSGIKPNQLTKSELATLVAESGVEKKTVIEVLRQQQLIDQALAFEYNGYDIAAELKAQSERALSTVEYVEKIGVDAASKWANKRFTSLSKRKLLLPVPYVKEVLEGVRAFSVSISKACELLMIDRYTFQERFSDLVAEVSE